MIVSSLTLRDFRSYASLELGLEPGIVLVVGPNGAGKTNLLESLHVGTQGFSPRTRADAQLVRFGAEAARVDIRGTRGDVAVETGVLLRRSGGREMKLNGAGVERMERLRSELATLVFTPDRLAVVKGGPAVRRAYFDRALGRLLPAQTGVPAAYGEALGQRNASLRRLALGLSDRDALAPWTERVAELGTELAAARRRVLELLGPGFAERAGELGLEDVALRYEGDPPTVDALTARIDRDVERGSTGLGPHLDEIAIVAGSRDLRSFGSQGEQRLAVLSLLLAEADLIAESRLSPPLLLLDDVLSELDPGRREILAARVGRRGQTVITTTSRQALPAEPAQVVEVVPGEARAV
ncbi:MAG TPA: DNA replication and repair protein RecF [Gaiellaceae bacterium]|nr:DNA replication and repair protein RecF [Gaiellaceae bacterium]